MEYSDTNTFRNHRRLDFEYLWKNDFSLTYPIDKMPVHLREKLKEFAWKVYFEGSRYDTAKIE